MRHIFSLWVSSFVFDYIGNKNVNFSKTSRKVKKKKQRWEKAVNNEQQIHMNYMNLLVLMEEWLLINIRCVQWQQGETIPQPEGLNDFLCVSLQNREKKKNLTKRLFFSNVQRGTNCNRKPAQTFKEMEMLLAS